MRIGVLIDEVLSGGVQRAAIEEVHWLGEMTHHPKLIVIRKSGRKSYSYEDLMENIPVEFLSDEFPILNYSFKFPIFSIFSTYHIASCIVARFSKLWNKFDIIVSHGLFASATAWSALMDNERYISFVWDPASYLIKKIYSRKLRPISQLLHYIAVHVEKKIIDSAALILTPSHVHLKILKNEYQIREGKIKVIYPGCYPAIKIPKNRGDYLLSFTRWNSGKNPYFLIELLKKLPDAKMIIAGEWTCKTDYQLFLQRIKRESLKNRVTLIPTLRTSDIPKLCSKARVWVYPNFEAFGMGALEAAAHGCPIVIPEGSGVTELFTHGIHGFFPKKGDIDAYAEYVDELLSNERLAWKMGYQAWEVAKSHSWENHARTLHNILKDV